MSTYTTYRDTSALTRNKLITSVKNGKLEVLEQLYKKYNNNFVKKMMRIYGCNAIYAQNVFKEALEVVSQRIKKGHLKQINTRDEKYLFDIGEKRLIVHLIKDQDPNIWQKVYTKHRNRFINWAVHHFSFCDKNIAQEVFQEVMVVLNEDIRRNRMTELHGNYLTTIGKRMLLNLHNRANIGYRVVNEWQCRYHDDGTVEIENNDTGLNHKAIAIVKHALSQLSTNCWEVFKLQYLQGWNMEMIASELGFANAQIAKNTRSRCLKRVRKQVGLLEKLQNIMW